MDALPDERLDEAISVLSTLRGADRLVEVHDFGADRLDRLAGLVSWGGDAVVDEDAIYDE